MVTREDKNLACVNLFFPFVRKQMVIREVPIGFVFAFEHKTPADLAANWIRHRPTELGIAGSSPAEVIYLALNSPAHTFFVQAPSDTGRPEPSASFERSSRVFCLAAERASCGLRKAILFWPRRNRSSFSTSRMVSLACPV